MTFLPIKRTALAVCGVIALCGTALIAQTSGQSSTQLFLDQLQVRPSTAPSSAVLLAIVGGKLAIVQLGSGITLNTGTNPPTINVAGVALPTPTVENYAYSAAASSQTLKYTPATEILFLVTRNGLVLLQGLDYTLSGSTVTFASANAPVAGDSYTFYYSH